jgi:hypothetical protein
MSVGGSHGSVIVTLKERIWRSIDVVVFLSLGRIGQIMSGGSMHGFKLGDGWVLSPWCLGRFAIVI